MQRQFEEELDQIKHGILTMAGLVEKSLEDVAKALTEPDLSLIHISEPTRPVGISRMPSSA